MSKVMTGDVLVIDKDLEKGRYTLFVSASNGEAYSIGIGTKKYIPSGEQGKPGTYEDDTEILAEANKILEKFNESIETIDNLVGREIEFYVSDDESQASFKEGIRNAGESFGDYTRYENLTPAEIREVKKSKDTYQLLPLEEWDGVRLNVGFEFPLKDGSVKKVRISQIVVEGQGDEPDKTLSLKYESKATKQLAKTIEGGNVSEDMKERTEQALKDLKQRVRNQVFAELSDAFGGADIETLIETGDQFQARIGVNELTTQTGVITYYTATIERDGE